jgi:hypothetical protein
MQKIIFKRLTVKEKERVTAGNESSDIYIPSSSSRINCNTVGQTVGNGCLLEQITTNDKLSCVVGNP